MKYRKIKNGFTLIEILLVIGVIMIMSIIKVRDINNDTEDMQAKILSSQIQTVAEATNAFLVLKYNELSTLSSPGVSCNTGANTCNITLQNLSDNALLPPNFSSNTIFGNPYEIQLKRTGTAPNYMISGLVLTKGNKNTENTPSLVFLGKVLRDIGRDGGLNKTTGQIIGTSNGWSANSTLFPILSNKVNYIGSAVGTLSGAYYVYLRRDGTLPMTGDLNMDGHNINNVNNLNATGVINTTGNIIGNNMIASGNISASGNINANGSMNAGGQITAHNGYGDSITVGGDGAGNDYEIKLSNASRQITIWSPDKGSIPNDANKDKMILQIAGSMKSGNIDVVGKITATDTLNVSKRITAGEYIQLNGIANAGQTCDSNGLQGRTSSGITLSCIGGIWQTEQPVGTPVAWPSETPPAGWLIANGQTFDVNAYPLLAKAYPSGKLPDLRGTFIRGLDQGRGIDSGRTILSDQRSSVVGGTDDNWSDNDFGVLHGPSSAYSRDSINVYDYTKGSNGQDPKYWVHMSSGTGPSSGNSETASGGIKLSNNGSNGFYGGARPYNISFVYIVRAL